MNRNYVVLEYNNNRVIYDDVRIRVTHEGCLQITQGEELHVTYSPAGWLKCWRLESRSIPVPETHEQLEIH